MCVHTYIDVIKQAEDWMEISLLFFPISNFSLSFEYSHIKLPEIICSFPFKLMAVSGLLPFI